MNTNRNLTAFLITLSLCISLTACSAAETNSFLTTSDTAVTTETITEETTEASEDDDRPSDRYVKTLRLKVNSEGVFVIEIQK